MNEWNHISRFYPFSEQLGLVLTLNNMETMLSTPRIMTVPIESFQYCINPQVR